MFALARPVLVVDVTGGWVLRVGGNSAICSGERAQARKWSRAFHEAWPDIEGICYRSSLNADWIAYALYERARDALPKIPLLNVPLTTSRMATLVANAALETRYELL